MLFSVQCRVDGAGGHELLVVLILITEMLTNICAKKRLIQLNHHILLNVVLHIGAIGKLVIGVR